MSINIDDLKKKIIYRSNYRGSKELDLLLSSFSKQIINNLNDEELNDLFNFLGLDDESLYKFYNGIKTSVTTKNNKISKLFKNFKLK